MKEKLKKFIQSKPVKTIGVVVLIGATAFAGAYMGIDYSMSHHHLHINIHDDNLIDNESKIETSTEEA